MDISERGWEHVSGIKSIKQQRDPCSGPKQ